VKIAMMREKIYEIFSLNKKMRKFIEKVFIAQSMNAENKNKKFK
jgi:hypothetical protein